MRGVQVIHRTHQLLVPRKCRPSRALSGVRPLIDRDFDEIVVTSRGLKLLTRLAPCVTSLQVDVRSGDPGRARTCDPRFRKTRPRRAFPSKTDGRDRRSMRVLLVFRQVFTLVYASGVNTRKATR